MNDLDQVIALDRLSFGVDRSFFLRRRLKLFPELCHVMMDGKRVTGFILGRGGERWVAAGPWVMNEEADNPVELLNAFALEAGDQLISIGILETNRQACDMVRSLSFKEQIDSP